MEKCEYFLQGENGYEISCLEWPCQKAEAALICLHGFCGDKYSSVIEAVAEKMHQEKVRTVTFDWPGHGSSPADGSYLTVESCLSDLNAVVRNIAQSDQKGLPLYMFATSFGGFLGLNYINRYPSVFSRVVLRSPALNMPETFRSLIDADQSAIFENGEPIEMGFDRKIQLGKEFYEDLCRHRLSCDAYPASVPGMIIHGDNDDVANPKDSEDFAHRNKLCLHIVEGADHRYKRQGDLEEIQSVTVPFLLDR